jgi:hypothetical protein
MGKQKGGKAVATNVGEKICSIMIGGKLNKSGKKRTTKKRTGKKRTTKKRTGKK